MTTRSWASLWLDGFPSNNQYFKRKFKFVYKSHIFTPILHISHSKTHPFFCLQSVAWPYAYCSISPYLRQHRKTGRIKTSPRHVPPSKSSGWRVNTKATTWDTMVHLVAGGLRYTTPPLYDKANCYDCRRIGFLLWKRHERKDTSSCWEIWFRMV